MKKFKGLAAVLAAAAATTAMFGMVACGEPGNNDGNKPDNKPGNQTSYVFEAEYTDLTGIQGKGYSSETTGTGLIMPDVHEDDEDFGTTKEGLAKASNGFFLSYMYANGLTITFKINSDAEVNDAKLTLRLSGELKEVIEFTDEEWVVKVNNEKISYGSIKIDGISTNMAVDAKREFQDFVVSDKVHLVNGENIITFTTNNSRGLGGTAAATAPLFDCIKIQTSAELKWNPVTSNLAKYTEDEE